MNLLYPIFSLDLTDITNSKIKKTQNTYLLLTHKKFEVFLF